MATEKAILGTPTDWLSRAKGDLALARVSLPEGGFYEDLCYHTQQSAEKAIKAVYRYYHLQFHYIHDIGVLLDDLKSSGREVPDKVEHARILTPYAIHVRYPGMDEEVTKETWAEAVRLAEEVVAWAESIVR